MPKEWAQTKSGNIRVTRYGEMPPATCGALPAPGVTSAGVARDNEPKRRRSLVPIARFGSGRQACPDRWPLRLTKRRVQAPLPGRGATTAGYGRSRNGMRQSASSQSRIPCQQSMSRASRWRANSCTPRPVWAAAT